MKLEERKDIYIKFLAENLEVIHKNNFVLLLVIPSVINRALALNRGFLQMETTKNYLCAIPLVRMQVDNCIRLYAYNMTIDEDTYSNWALSGELLNKLKDKKTNKSLTDKLVLNELKQFFPHLLKLYEECSSYVHFSNNLIKYAASANSNDRKISMRIGDYDEFTEEAKDNIRAGMEYANDTLFCIMTSILRSIDNRTTN